MRLKLKPAQGLIVRDPHTRKPLAEDGTEVLDSSYWRRRIKSGDAVLVEEVKPAKTEKPSKRGES